MINYPFGFSGLISPFAPNFSEKVFEHAGQLLLGCILTCGKRIVLVCGVLRTLGLASKSNLYPYGPWAVPTKWSALYYPRYFSDRCFAAFWQMKRPWFSASMRRWCTAGDRKSKHVAFTGIAVRSSKSHLVSSSWLRWMCLLLLTIISWQTVPSTREALPFPCPSRKWLCSVFLPESGIFGLPCSSFS